jgi:hypothetical protein
MNLALRSIRLFGFRGVFKYLKNRIYYFKNNKSSAGKD